MRTILIIISIIIKEISLFPFSENYFSISLNKPVYENKIYKPGIKTVLIYRKGWELSFPIINLNSKEQIELIFDELGNEPGDYSWSIIHCNMQWEKDDLEPIQYLSGLETGDITEIYFSQNTMVNYINYRLNLPNKNCRITKSGNYLILIHERNNPEKVILTQRFYVIEPQSEISAYVDQLKTNIKEGLNQRLNIEINYNESELTDPIENLSLKIYKNQGFEKNYRGIRPSAISGNILKYQKNDELCFTGGNEFRHFDIKNTKFLSDRIQKTEKKAEGLNIYLTLDENRYNSPYRFEPDINGQKSIKLENNDQSSIMADYSFVNFYLDTEIAIEKGDYYIFGAISDWSFNDSCKLTYDYIAKMYSAKLFLKQGYYNYQFLFKTDDKFYDSDQYIYKVEGNHFQTENEYQILAYYADMNESYDKLVGYNTAKSTISGNY
jgi:hypothetical protein